MRLRTKTMIVAAVTFAVLFVLLDVGLIGATERSILRQEHLANQTSLEQARYHVANILKDIDIAVHDWSAWDDTYNFVEDSNPAFIESNLNKTTFKNLQINVLIIADNAGNLVYARGVDSQLNDIPSLPPELSDLLKPGGFLAARGDVDAAKHGLLDTGMGVLAVAARPILNSNGEGPAKGTLLMAQVLDSKTVNKTNVVLNMSIDILTAKSPELPAGLWEKLAAPGGASPRQWIKPVSASEVRGYALLEDILGTPAFVLRIRQGRPYYEDWRTFSQLLLITIICMVVLLGLVLYWMQGRYIIDPLEQLSQKLMAIGASGDLSSRVAVRGTDEMSKLASTINTMLENMQLAQSGQQLSEARYEALYHRTPAMLHSFDRQGRLVQVSDYWLEVMGYSRADVLGRMATDFMTSESSSYVKQRVLPLFFTAGEVTEVPCQLITRQGSVIETLLSATAERDERGEITRSLAVMVDVTERKKADEELRQKAAEMSAITSAFPDLYFRTTLDGRFLDFLGTDYMDLTSSPRDIIGRHYREILPEAVAEQFDRIYYRITSGHEVYAIEYSLPVAGRNKWFEARLTRLPNQQVLAIVRNITEKKHSELVQLVLLRISEAASAAESVGSLAQIVHEELQRLLDARNFYVALYNPAADTYDFPYFSDEYDRDFSSESMKSSLTDYVRRTGKPLLSNDEIRDQLMAKGEVQLVGTPSRSWLGAPLKTAQGTIGVVVVQSYSQSSTYTEQDLELLAFVSDHVSMAVGRKRADEELKRLYASLESLVEERTAELAVANQRLQTTQLQQKALLDSIPDLAWLKDRQGRFIAVNEPFGRSCGYQPGELTGKTDYDIWPAELAARYLADDKQVMQLRLTKRVEEPLVDSDGSNRWIETIKVPILNEEGEVIGTAGIARDITERKEAEDLLLRSHAELEKLVAERTAELESVNAELRTDISEREKIEEALRASEESYRKLVELAQEGIITVDVNERITFANPTFYLALGFEKDEVIGRRITELCDEQMALEILRHTSDRQQGVVSTYEVQLITKQGEMKDFLSAVNPLFDRRGEYEGALAVMTDITERKRTERALMHAQKLESLGVLAGGIAHDFNNLLVGIMGNVGLALKENQVTAGLRRYLEDIERASQRAADLTRQMLAYSGKGHLVTERFDMTEVVEEMGRLVGAAIPKNVVLKYHMSRELPAVEGDPVQIRQVVMNLILNAAEAIGERSGVVSIATGQMLVDAAYLQGAYLNQELPAGNYIYLEVSDTGCGMDASTLARIFDPFFTTKFTGRGLGLAAVLGIVRSHRGTVKVYSEVNKGSTFKILLPATRTGTEPLISPENATPAWRGSGTVLVVDDEPTVRVVAKRILEQQGFEVIVAKDGQEGVDLFAQNAEKVALVLLDMTMPKLSGEEAYREIRRVRSDVPVVLSSGYNEQDATERFAGKGLAAFLQKPYSPTDLLETTYNILFGDGIGYGRGQGGKSRG